MTLIHIAGKNSESHLTVIGEDAVQPNAVDLNLDGVWKLYGPFQIDEEGKVHRERTKVEPDSDGYYVLEPGSYEVSFEGLVSMGAEEAGWVITRSTLNRNGIYFTSGLYDSGYNGSMASCIHITTDIARIKKGTRVAQFILVESEALKKYDGDYGIGKTMDAHLRTE